jgi:eukaryotic-like serine/threonine-protein kinase
MECPGADLLAELADGRLGADAVEAIETHLDACAECSEVAAAIGAAHGGSPEQGELGQLAERYRVSELVARGGMGSVYRAVDTVLRREIAFKVLEDDTPGLRERFIREALITARLQHPAIVPIYDAGYQADGSLGYSMKLVSGQPLDQALDACKTTSDRMALLPNLITVAEAVAYAHAHGVVHRDLKPGNIIVGELGETVVIDWGIAKDLSAGGPDEQHGDSTAPEHEALTRIGVVVGTPAYMSPEQAQGLAVDERADVFSIGVILYELLAGRRPYQSENVTSLLAALREGPPPPIEAVAPDAPKELCAIVKRAMERDVAARYRARELAEELRHYSTGRLVQAHDYTIWQLVLRQLRRHRAAVWVGAVAAMLIAAVGVVSTVRVIRERDAARRAEAVAAAGAEELRVRQAFSVHQRDPRRALELVAALPADSPWWRRGRIIAAAARHRVPIELDGASQAVRRLDYLSGETLAAFSENSFQVWRLRERRHESRSLAGLAHVTLSADGRTLVAVSGTRIVLIELEQGRERQLGEAPSDVERLAISSDRRHLAIATRTALHLWSLDVDRAQVLGEEQDLELLGFSPAGDFVLGAASVDLQGERVRTLVEWTIATGERRVHSFRSEPVDPSRFWISTDGTRIATRHRNGRSVLWWERMTPRRGAWFVPAVEHVAFAPGDGELAFAADRTVTIDQPDGRSTIEHAAPVVGIAYLPDGTGLASASRDQTMAFSRRGLSYYQTFLHPRAVTALAISPDGRSIATAAEDGILRLWPTPAERVLALPARTQHVALAQGGRVAITAEEDGAIVRRPTDGAPTELVGTVPWPTASLAVSPTGRVVAVAGTGLVVFGAGAQPLFLGDPQVRCTTVAVSADETMLAAICGETLWSWRIPAGTSRALGPAKPGAAVALAPDARWVASGGSTVQIIDLASGQVRTLEGHEGRILGLASSPDGASLASIGEDSTLRIWPLAGGPARIYDEHRGGVTSVAFSGDGTLVVTGGNDRTVRLWDPTTGINYDSMDHAAAVVAVAFDPAVALLVSADRASVLLRPFALPATPAEIRSWANP